MGGRHPNLGSAAVLAVLSALVLVLAAGAAGAAQVTLAWDANTEADLAGYRVFHGISSGSYTSTTDVGKRTIFTVTGLQEGTVYYFAATAYDTSGNESGFSNEVAWAAYEVPDADGDGLSDDLEEASCTEALDADSDDDGISDGAEDADRDGLRGAGETSPCQADTDGDGLQDGTELGYTAADVGPDTDLAFFVPDLDPASVTDPLNADTDGDGLADGVEDANGNGRQDEGETSPAVPDIDTIFADDFSDGTPAGDFDWEEVSGRWSVNALGQYMSSARLVNRALVGEHRLGAVEAGRIECLVRLTRRFKREANAAVIFGWQDRTHYRYVRLRPSGVTIGQAGDDPLEIRGVKTRARVALETGVWYRLRVDMETSGRVAVYLDGALQPIADYSFGQPSPGRVGLMAREARAGFDDYTVSGETPLP